MHFLHSNFSTFGPDEKKTKNKKVSSITKLKEAVTVPIVRVETSFDTWDGFCSIWAKKKKKKEQNPTSNVHV